MRNYDKYAEIKIERERSQYPQGLRHKRKDTLLENSLFDFEILLYKVIGITKGVGNGTKDKTGNETES